MGKMNKAEWYKAELEKGRMIFKTGLIPLYQMSNWNKMNYISQLSMI